MMKYQILEVENKDQTHDLYMNIKDIQNLIRLFKNKYPSGVGCNVCLEDLLRELHEIEEGV